MRDYVTFNGNKYGASRRCQTIAVWVGNNDVKPKDFLNQTILFNNTELVVYEAYDPYAPPYSYNHKNEGKVVEVRVVYPGEEIPESTGTYKDCRRTKRAKFIDGKIVEED